MSTIIRKSQILKMKSFDNLFIEMTSMYCNQKCKHCYINFPQFKKVQDFISIGVVEQALSDISKDDVKCIYLTGAEPMTHPDFNAILRLCLKKTNVCICTNGSFINEKKARFLKKVESESANEVIFQISLDHYDEEKNDEIRYRGAYRHALFAIKHLFKYNFAPIVSVTNYYQEDEKSLRNHFLELLKDYDIDNNHIIIRQSYDKNSNFDFKNLDQLNGRKDCEYGRVLTANGIYSCPFLSNDYRGRCGKTLADYSGVVPLETDFCQVCVNSHNELFGINFKIFN